MMPTREQAWQLLNQYNASDALIKHALAVEGVMRYYARIYGQDEELWAIVGLLHDLDYEQYPDQHCQKTAEIMRQQGYDEIIVRACISHGYGICCDVAPESDMEKVLYTVDELTGLVNAAALMRPSHSVMDLEVKSLKKKFKAKAFASGVNREVIQNGVELLGAELGEVMQNTIMGMREVAEALGLS